MDQAKETGTNSRQIFAELTRHLPTACFATDEQGVLIEWNKAADGLYGYSRDQALGQKPKDLIGIAYVDLNRRVFAGKDFKNAALSGHRRDGRHVRVLANLYPVYDEDGKVVMAASIHRLLDADSVLKGIDEEFERDQHSDRILAAISEAATILLRSSDIDKGFDRFLSILGRAVGVSRVYIFSNHEDEEGDLLMSQLWEWAAEGVEAQADNPGLKNLPYEDAGFSRWIKLMSEGKPVYGLVEKFPASERKLLASQKILSLAVVPIFTGDIWWGFVGFDDCRTPRRWSSAEIGVLKTAAGVMGAAIEHRRMEKELRYWSEFNRNIVEASSLALYVLDTQGRIKVWNKGMEARFDIQAADVLGENVFTVFKELNRNRLGASLHKALKDKEGFSFDEIDFRVPEKGLRILQVRASPLFDGEGRMEGLLVINSDITEQRRAEMHLEQSEEMYRAITESSLIGFYIYREGRFLYANEQMSRITGYKSEELLDIDTEKLVAPDDRQRLAEEVEEMKKTKGTSHHYTFKMRRKDGSFGFLEVYTRRILYQGQPATVGSCIDVTNRVSAQSELQSSEKLYRSTINAMADVIHVIDQDMRIVMHNLALRLWAANHGLEIDEIIGKSVFDVFPFLPDKVAKEYQKVWKTGKPLLTEETTALGKKDIITETRKIPVKDKEGKVKRIVTVVRGVTEPKQVEEALRESELKYSTLVEQARDGLLIVQEEVCKFTNRAMAKISGYGVEEIVGMRFGDLLEPKSSDQIAKRYKLRMGGRSVPSIYEARLRCKDGGLKDVEISTAIIKYRGQDAGMGIVRDITERKRAETEIKRRSEELSELLDITTTVSASLNPEEVIGQIAERAGGLIGASGCTIYRLEEETDELIPQTTTVRADREARLAYPIPVGKGITGKAASRRKPLLANQAHKNADAIRIPGTDESAHSILAAPLLAHGKLWGVMSLVRLNEETFTQHDLELFSLFANQVADAVVNSNLFSRLRESEEKYRSFVEQAIDGIVIIQDGRFVFANQGAARMLGYSKPEDILKMQFADLLAPEVKDELTERYKRRLAGEKVSNVYETKLQAADGTILEAELNADLIHYEGHPAVLVFARDIRERKQTEEALRKERDKAQMYLDIAGVMIVVIDRAQNTVIINRKGCDILGFKETEIVGKNWFENFVPGRVRKETRGDFEEMMGGERKPPEHLVSPVLTRDGEERLILWHNSILRDENGNITGTLGSGEDVTEQKRAEEALGKERTTLKQMIELNPYAIAIYDREGHYISGNQAYVNLFGSTPPKGNYCVFEDPILKKAGFADRLRKTRDGKVIRIPDLWFKSEKDGKEGICVRSVAFPIFDPSGEFENLVIMHEDVTERKAAEEALKDSEERYRTLQSNVPVGVFRIDEEGRVLAANPALVKMLRYPSEKEMISESKSDSPLSDIQNIADNLYKDNSISDVEMELKRSNGNTFWGSISARKITAESGKVHYDGIIVDISERKRIEEALREGERFLSSIFGSIQDGLSILDKNMNIIRVNSTMENWFGHAMPLIGKKCYELYYGRDEPCEVCPARKTLKSGQATYEVVPKLGSDGGTTGWFDLYSFPLVDVTTGKMQGIIEYVRDITDRKKAEEALRESEERYRSLFEDSPISLWEEDLSGVRTYLQELSGKGIKYFDKYFIENPEEVIRCASLVKVLDVNRTTLELYGAKTKDELLEAFNSIFSDESFNLVRKELVRIAKGETSFVEEGVNLTLKGDVIYVNLRFTAAPGHEKTLSKVLISITDVTERKKFEQALRESEEFSRAVIERSPLGISVRTPNGRLLSANESWERIWAIGNKELNKDLEEQRTSLQFDERDSYLEGYLPQVEKVYSDGQELHIP
ncbi:PAS domain S-box protein, partial [candidate division WOR-3 bacterium]|nr:PAS domain S-box protein [candidate division WOR-3 bacterium]MBD3364363.1 PAS domain S-box protein [candidate division WOR-3 bacterium]